MAKTKLKHYVKFLYPGVLVLESSVQEVPTRDVAPVRVPKKCFGYQFFDRQETVSEDNEILTGVPKNHSGTYYPGGRVMTLEDVIRKMPNADTLISNMKNNGYDRVVETRRGNFQPFTEEDKIVGKE